MWNDTEGEDKGIYSNRLIADVVDELYHSKRIEYVVLLNCLKKNFYEFLPIKKNCNY